MNSEQKKSIKSTILECRDILEKDIEQVLIGYGIYIDKDWINIRHLTNLTEEQEQVRKNIEEAIEKLQKGGFDKSKSVIEYIKEVSYTYLNRLAALRVMEVRGLIDEILIPRGEYGNRSFMNSRFYEVAREYCKFQEDEGLSYLLNIMFEEISEEIKMLFNTEDEYSFIAPSSTSLLKVIDLLCTDISEEAWKQDEIIGWIYQYFNDKEKEDVFDRLYNEKQKIKVEDIPAATQLFTPDWIVDWIVNNSLGTLWEEIKQGKREGKEVEKIKLLDPCCGSGHFLVKAYDLFYDMYVEEDKYTKEEIPLKILENNIYGIDIDLRAVQLTALILFIKTKSSLKENGYNINTKGQLSVNLVCADAILLNGSRLEALKEKHKSNKTLLKMIEIIYEEFEDVRLKGSLIQPEKKLFPLFEEFKDRIAKKELRKSKTNKKKQTKGQEKLLDDEVVSLSTYKSQRDFTKEEKELMASLEAIYSEAIKANDISRQLFATEATKSIKLVDIFMKRYDVVVTNPPYMGSSGMDHKLKSFITRNYEIGKEDLYSTFILRCIEMTTKNGLLGMITQHGFMFTAKYGGLRDHIIEKKFIKKVVHLGTGVFEDLNGEKVESAMFVIQKESNENKSTFIDLRDKIDKHLYCNINMDESDKYIVNQSVFKNIKGTPFLYKLSEELLLKFNLSNFDDYAHVQRGISTSKDSKYMRYFWEVRDFNRWKMNNRVSSEAKYLTEDNIVIDWSSEAINFYKSKNGLTGQDFYFKEGLFFSKAPYKANFSVRYLNDKSIINDSKPSIFFKDNKNLFLFLGILNSNLFIFFMNIINPTNAFQVGDIKKLPILEFNNNDSEKIKNIAKENLDITKELLTYSVISKYYLTKRYTGSKTMGIKEVIMDNLISKDRLLLKRVKNELEIDRIVYKTYNISSQEIKFICQENKISNGDIKSKDSIEKLLLSQTNNINYEKLSFEADINIVDLIEYRIENKLYGNKTIRSELKLFLDSYIGLALGSNEEFNRIENKEGIIPFNSSIFVKDIIQEIYDVVSILFNDDKSDENFEEIETILGKSIEEYMIKDFFKDHRSLYEKRPIYWHICSPKKTFNCFVYYHKLDNDTLYKVKSIYLSQMIDRYEEDLKYYNDQLIKARTDKDKSKEKDLKKRCSDLEEKLEDLNVLDEKIMEILPYKPDIDEGVLYNIIPLESILSSTVSTKTEREKYYEEVERR